MGRAMVLTYIPPMRLPRFAVPALGALLLAFPLGAQRPTPRTPVRPSPAKPAPTTPAAPAVPTTGFLQGVAMDSLHGEPLVGALISVEGTARMAITDSLGRFLIDSIEPGSRRVLVDHPLLDTLGISLVTPAMTIGANELTRIVIPVPTGEFLVNLFCPAARRALGPGALVGRVREPDSDSAAVGARVSVVWYDPDPPGLPANIRVAKKPPRVREATVGPDGTYRLCGLPDKYEAKLQAQRKDGGATAEVTVTQDGGVLALRSMSVAALPAVATTRDSTGATVVQQPRGTARVFGKVVNRNGAPVVGARVGLMGTSAATLTRANGDFVLDSLPAGTQALVVRQIGYRPTELAVDLSSRTPARVTVQLGMFVPELSPVEVVSRRDEGLQKVGFLDRKRTSASGYFMGPEQLEKRNPMKFTDILRSTPGIRVTEQNGQAMITSTRSAQANGCVTMYVDGAQWQQLEPGDLDSFVQPNEVAAIEVYSGASVPPQFSQAGQSCAAVVVWTKTRVQSRRR
jgi:hypothetical protein